MTTLRIIITLRAPTVISQRPTAPGQVSETALYLSGTALRAAIAGSWLRGRRYAELEDPAQQERFRTYFIGDTLRFPNALPLHPRQPLRIATQVVPATAWTKKASPGWRDERGASGVRDALAALLHPGDQLLSEEWEGWDPLGDSFAAEDDGAWLPVRPRRRLITRTALTDVRRIQEAPSRGTVLDGQLFTVEALEAGQQFMASIGGDPVVLAELYADLAGDQEERPDRIGLSLRIGQGSSRGLGAALAELTVVHTEVPQRSADQVLSDARHFSARAGCADGVYLPVTLESDLVLRDNYLLPCASGNPTETLFRYLTPTPGAQAMRLHEAVQRTRWLGGWDALRRVPRAPQLAVQAGSVWIYHVQGEQAPDAISWWLRAERDGIGERRGEGFGRVRLLHPLHTKEKLL